MRRAPRSGDICADRRGNRVADRIEDEGLDELQCLALCEALPLGMSLSVNGIEHSERGGLGVAGWVPVSTWLLRTAYFGGDEKAPHTMHIDVRGVVVDDVCRR